MSLVINSNLASMNAQNNLSKASNEQQEAMERLSSGKRINSGKDDAAGLAIATKMTSQINGMNQATRNANDGISMIQTADGALEQQENILQRMNELAVQSANGTYGEGNRNTLNAEMKQLTSELDRIAESTTFNEQNLLDGTQKGGVKLQIGANAGDTIEFSLDKMDAKTLGLGSTAADQMGAAVDLEAAVLVKGDIEINGQKLEAHVLADTVQDLIDNVDDNITGVTAGVYAESEAGRVGTGILQGSEKMTVTLTELDGNSFSFDVTDTEDMDQLIEKIETNSGNRVSASLNDEGRLVMSTESASTMTITSTGGGTTSTEVEAATGFDVDTDALIGTAQAVTTNASLTLSSENGDPITVERGATGKIADLNAIGFRETDTAGEIEGVSIATPTNAWGVGDVTINGEQIDETDTDSLQGKVDAINKATDATGVTASSYSSMSIDLTTADFSAGGEIDGKLLSVNGHQLTFSALNAEDFAADFNAQTASTGVTATVRGNFIELESAGAMVFGDQNSDDLILGTPGTDSGLVFEFNDGTQDAATDFSGGQANVAAGLKLESASGSPISVELGDNATAADVGLLDTNSTAAGRFGASVNSIDVSTVAGAEKAIGIIKNALETVSDSRSELGAMNNRLDFTVANLSSSSENAQAARSRIEDADFASESAALSRAQVLQQASQTMLAQANSQPQQVLSLLQ